MEETILPIGSMSPIQVCKSHWQGGGEVVARWWQHGNAPAVLKGRDNPTCLHVQVAGRLLV